MAVFARDGSCLRGRCPRLCLPRARRRPHADSACAKAVRAPELRLESRTRIGNLSAALIQGGVQERCMGSGGEGGGEGGGSSVPSVARMSRRGSARSTPIAEAHRTCAEAKLFCRESAEREKRCSEWGEGRESGSRPPRPTTTQGLPKKSFSSRMMRVIHALGPC